MVLALVGDSTMTRASPARATAPARGFSALGFARPAGFLAGSSALAALAREARFTVCFGVVAMSPV